MDELIKDLQAILKEIDLINKGVECFFRKDWDGLHKIDKEMEDIKTIEKAEEIVNEQ
jgi:hypothetical protein